MRRSTFETLAFAAALSVLFLAGSFALAQEVDDSTLFEALRATEAPEGFVAPLQVELNEPLFQEPIEGDRRQRVGHAAALGADVRFRGLRRSQFSNRPLRVAGGSIQATADGFAWSVSVVSEGAVGVRLRFTGFFLPRDTELYLYNDSGDVYGPYRHRGPHGDGEFWSHAVAGSRVRMQLLYRGADIDRVLGASRFVISDVGHLNRDFPVFPSEEDHDQFCSFNEPCVHNASCETIPVLVQPALDAVALILFAEGRWLYICSGGLVETRPPTGTPYFLTANHCISKGRTARNVQTFFGFRTPCSNPDCSFPSTESTLGSSLQRTNRTSDYSLLRLNEAAPGTADFLPWNDQPVAFTDGQALYRISHPAGAPQAYSEHAVDTSRPTCTSWPRGDWIYSSDLNGATEGGSSGSPVVNSQGELVGQLSGACGFNVGDSCDEASNATVDGAFAAYAGDLLEFLEPGGAVCTDADGDSYCMGTDPGDDCDDGDAAINPGASEFCTDGVDNDCDGLADTLDPDCDVGSCILEPDGSSCSADSDCCSNKCKGRPRGKTCKAA